MDGRDTRRPDRGERCGLRSEIYAAVVVLGGSGGDKIHAATAPQYVGHCRQDRRAFGYYRRWQMLRSQLMPNQSTETRSEEYPLNHYERQRD